MYKQIFAKQGAIENVYGKMPFLARFRQVTKGHTMHPQSKQAWSVLALSVRIIKNKKDTQTSVLFRWSRGVVCLTKPLQILAFFPLCNFYENYLTLYFLHKLLDLFMNR